MRRKTTTYGHGREESGKLRKILTEVAIWLVEAVIVLSASYFLTQQVLERTTVIGNSMAPTLAEGTTMLINRYIYAFKTPGRGDVIVYKQSNQEHDYYQVGRIIGLPGETVTIKDGQIYLNGQVYEENLALETIENPGLAEDGVYVDTFEYFVLGDNRNSSEDSRFANVGNIVRSDVIGKAWITLDPFAFISQLGVGESLPAGSGGIAAE